METEKKKRAKPVTTTSRSRTWLEKQGFIVALVERTMWFPQRINGIPTGRNIPMKFDCFGFADLVAVHPDIPGTSYIQTTSRDHQAERRQKVIDAVAVPTILKAGNDVYVHGWGKTGARGKRKLWQVSVFKARLNSSGVVVMEEVEEGTIDDDGEEVVSLFK